MLPFYTLWKHQKPKITSIFQGVKNENILRKRKTKSFIIPFKESIMSKLFKILNHKGDVRKKKFRTEIITPSFFVSLLKSTSSFLAKSFVCFCSLLKYLFTTVLVANFSLQSWTDGELVIYPGFSNALSETLWTYTFYVIVFNCWWNKVNNAKGLEIKITQQKQSPRDVL